MGVRILERLIGIVAGLLGVALLVAAAEHLGEPVVASVPAGRAPVAAAAKEVPARIEAPATRRTVRLPQVAAVREVVAAGLPDAIAKRAPVRVVRQARIVHTQIAAPAVPGPNAVSGSHVRSGAKPLALASPTPPVGDVADPNATPEPPLGYDPEPAIVTSAVDDPAATPATPSADDLPVLAAPHKRRR
jgi:hypothetical protein